MDSEDSEDKKGPRLAVENTSPMFFFRSSGGKTDRLAETARMKILDNAIDDAEKKGNKTEAKTLRILKEKRSKELENDNSH